MTLITAGLNHVCTLSIILFERFKYSHMKSSRKFSEHSICKWNAVTYTGHGQYGDERAA